MQRAHLKEVLTAPRRITTHVSEEQIKSDLEKYVTLAKKFGASDAKVIEAKDVIVDDRVQMKCMVPSCYRYGNSPFCPPNVPGAEAIEKVVKKYRYAILIKHEVTPKEDFISPGQGDDSIRKIGKHHGAIMNLVTQVETLAFNDGYYLALGFGGGSCKTALCKGAECARANGELCRFPSKARPSMEAVGIDVYNIVTKVGWEIYPIGPSDIDPQLIPCALSVGIVFIC